MSNYIPTKINRDEIAEIEDFGPYSLFYELDFCPVCKEYYYKQDMKQVKKRFVCIACINLLAEALGELS